MDWFRLRSRGALVAATVAVQAIVIGVGGLLSFNYVYERTSTRVRDELVAERRQEADRIAERLLSDFHEPIEYGSPDWARAQDVIESFAEQAGVVYLLDDSTRVLCHPNLKTNPRLRQTSYAGQPIQLTDGTSNLTLGDVRPTTTVVGKGEFLWGTDLLAIRHLPELHATVVVHQPEEMTADAVNRATSGMIVIGGISALVVLALTAFGSAILVRRYDSMLMRINRDLEQEVVKKVKAGLNIRNSLIFGLAKLADYRDTDTGKHLERICRYCEVLARELRPIHPEIDEAWIERLKLASSMHDIGKVGIPDAILLKPGMLSPEERRLMEQHPLIGADTLVAIRKRTGDDDLINMGIQVALYHHERWDGTGYPFGLAGEDIPLAARICAVADVYDAMTSKRVYKNAMSHEVAHKIIVESSGTHMDPSIAVVFDRLNTQFDAIRRELQPDGADPDKPVLLTAVERALKAQEIAASKSAA
ncbi:MAG: HD-GYP domain-containing protein [Phycisphaerales bacterium]|nr:MAG: HD domain-containing protein [Phycisphaerales bacterium]